MAALTCAITYTLSEPVRRGNELNTRDTQPEQPAKVGRRSFIAGTLAAAASAAALGQSRDYGQNAPPVRYPDPDVVVLDQRFAKYKINNASIQRLYTGMLWAEGPAW